MARLRVGVIGCGYYARYHLEAWKTLTREGIDLVAVCDLDADKAAAAAREFGAPQSFTDASILDEVRLDLVDIATRMDTHRALAAACAERGIGVIVQKPLAPTWDEAVAIVARAEQAGSFLAVHENFRFQPAMQRVAEIVRSGAIGEPSWSRIAVRTGVDVYKNQPYFLNEERLVILDLGIHLLDLARLFMGEVENVFCQTQRRNPAVRAEDTATMMLRHVGGAVSVVECTYESRRLPDALGETILEIEGTDGVLTLDRQLTLAVSSKGQHRTERLVPEGFDFSDPGASIAAGSALATCRAHADAFRAGQAAETSGADNLKTYALVEAAYRSVISGSPEIPPSRAPN
ncbi:Gfo/Idh/MocA family oxidoreductase [Devosia algicola]|uniref:Gfo/Idh/MocA family oxidoreductase n=1 Tax=Devosia algicola TaxID=3026418 RepID=A0ABY7YQU9_9HYPH|nr:Gfo/Idh/MocA family oxidoreductase [Devosia algicola]WDR03562.1 Gfo/Idh/MocA family oxidoreductase [Devosia algicola]